MSSAGKASSVFRCIALSERSRLGGKRSIRVRQVLVN
jgi:hypothetical protein